MARSYTLKTRAEKQARTRQKIVDAAVELHGTVGPARTSLSMVAERAGVQRNTLYAHFPDEWSLLLACSGHTMERDPPPDAEGWRNLPVGERLRAGLKAIYGWYRANAQLLACVLRDAEQHEGVRKVSEMRYGPVVAAWHEVLGGGLLPEQQALLHLALGYHSWRALVLEAGLADEAAVDLMAGAVEGAASRA
ncbi:MAG TPA: TetR/AcrR family transcriptional regulator [Caulobacteraceae bacterium]